MTNSCHITVRIMIFRKGGDTIDRNSNLLSKLRHANDRFRIIRN